MVRTAGTIEWLVHAFVECRAQGAPWWLYARVAVSSDARLIARMVQEGLEEDEAPLGHEGVPFDLSREVLDEYTWRVSGRYGGDAGNIVSVEEATAWLQRGVSSRWRTPEPLVRVTDPRWEHPTWLTRDELDAVITNHEAAEGESAPATWCAVLATMNALSRDYSTRLILWLERAFRSSVAHERQPMHRDHAAELGRAVARARDGMPS
jgi:hypothetical protein